ncbi:MAG: DUF2817 domain-containing protein [Oscillospiraceae bacterium]|nr:DUF2817 domain-containing protein [Oscillospiraceae bacterium]
MFVFPETPWCAPRSIPGGSCDDAVVLTEASEQVIYDIYDALAEAFPDQIKKQVMGEVMSHKINRYTIMPRKALWHRIPVVTLLHGREAGCAWTAAHFFRLLLLEDDPRLDILRNHVCFDVIPVANPWGFAHDLRKNANGIDLNRNFAPDFVYDRDPESSEYGGPFPGSETETQVLMQLLEENKDATVVLDYHNVGNRYPLFYTYGGPEVQLAETVFPALTKKWQQDYPQLRDVPALGLHKPNGHEGMFADYIISKGLWALTMETPMTMPGLSQTKFDTPTIHISLEVLVNTLLTITASMPKK